jgi:hypothetical protein
MLVCLCLLCTVWAAFVRVGMPYVVGVHLCYYNTTVQLNSDWLRAGGSGFRIPVAVRFSESLNIGPAVHPTSYTKGTVFL